MAADIPKDVRIDVRRHPWTSLQTSADVHMEILRISVKKKFPACVDLRTQFSNTTQTYAGKRPQFSMQNIAFFADISGTTIASNKPSSPILNFYDFLLKNHTLGIPNTAAIFQNGVNKSSICCLFCTLRTLIKILSRETKSSICLSTHY